MTFDGLSCSVTHASILIVNACNYTVFSGKITLPIFSYTLSGYVLTNLEEACENVELKHRNIVVASKVNGGFEGHSLQS